MPFCLFIKNDNYRDWKEENDLIELDYKGFCYQLTFTIDPKNQWPIKKMIEMCLEQYEKRQIAQEAYRPSPYAEQMEREEKEKCAQMKQRFEREFASERELPLLTFFEIPHQSYFKSSEGNDMLLVDLPGIQFENTRFFYSENSFAIYGSSKEREYLCINDFGQQYSKKRMQSATKEMENGELKIFIPKETT